VLLDSLLWGLPRLSVAALFRDLAEFYESAVTMEGMSADMADMAGQAATLLNELGRNSNLFNMLVSNSLMHVPSIMVVAEPLSGMVVHQIDNPWNAVGLSVLFSLIGIFVGVVYIGLLAHHLPIGKGEKPTTPLRFLAVSARRWMLVVLFLLLTIFLLLAVYIPASIVIALIALLIPAISSLLVLLLGGITFLLFFYLYFVVVALVLDDLSIFDAVMCSMRLVRTNFWATLGFVLLVNLISIGFTLLLAPMTTSAPGGTALAILINAYIGTGLTMSILVFYRTRLLKMEEVNGQLV
jgi:hypothetical protein